MAINRSSMDGNEIMTTASDDAMNQQIAETRKALKDLRRKGAAAQSHHNQILQDVHVREEQIRLRRRNIRRLIQNENDRPQYFQAIVEATIDQEENGAAAENSMPANERKAILQHEAVFCQALHAIAETSTFQAHFQSLMVNAVNDLNEEVNAYAEIASYEMKELMEEVNHRSTAWDELQLDRWIELQRQEKEIASLKKRLVLSSKSSCWKPKDGSGAAPVVENTVSKDKIELLDDHSELSTIGTSSFSTLLLSSASWEEEDHVPNPVEEEVDEDHPENSRIKAMRDRLQATLQRKEETLSRWRRASISAFSTSMDAIVPFTDEEDMEEQREEVVEFRHGLYDEASPSFSWDNAFHQRNTSVDTILDLSAMGLQGDEANILEDDQHTLHREAEEFRLLQQETRL